MGDVRNGKVFPTPEFQAYLREIRRRTGGTSNTNSFDDVLPLMGAPVGVPHAQVVSAGPVGVGMSPDPSAAPVAAVSIDPISAETV